MKTLNKLFVLIFSIIVISCTPEAIDGQDGRDGRDGANGINGIDGADGESGASIGMTVNALGNGCNELTFYYDTNNNKQNDNETVISTITVCDGQDASQVGPQGPQGATGATGATGPTGATGATGPQGQSVALFIETATIEQCTNSGFVINLFDDNNNDAIYNTGDVLVSNNVICYPDADSVEFPDYSEMGHTFPAIGIWRLYSVEGFPVPESNRFNIKIYPDPLNPVLLTGNGTIEPYDTGLMDFGDNIGIPWRYNVSGGDSFNPIFIDFELIEGFQYLNNTDKSNYINSRRNSVHFYNEADPLRLELMISKTNLDMNLFPGGLLKAVFYKISD